MRQIKKLVNAINEELSDSKRYTEKYLEYKVDNDDRLAQTYKQMAEDEYKHAMNLHEQAIEEIDKIRKVFIPPMDMQEKWKESHARYIEKSNHIRNMLDN